MHKSVLFLPRQTHVCLPGSRYNEAALDNDILELLVSWKDHLQAADLIFVQAPSSNARSVFLSSSEQAAPGPKAGLLNPNDPRVRRIPFSTQRPTFSEARRAVGLLTAVFEPNAAALAAQQAADEAAAAAVQQKEERAQQKLAAKQQRKVQGEAAGSGSAGREQGNAAPAPVEIKVWSLACLQPTCGQPVCTRAPVWKCTNI